MSIFNSNDYNRGHRDGTKDAMNNKDKNYVRSGMSMKLCHGSAPDSLSYGQGALTILLAYYIGKKVNCS